MASLPTHKQTELSLLLSAAETAIDAGVVAATARERRKYWQHWFRFASYYEVDPMLKNVSRINQAELLKAYAERVRTGYYGRKHRVRAQTVQVALRAIGTTFEMAMLDNPCHRSPNRYIKPLERQIEGYRRTDPPTVAKLAVPVAVPEHIHNCAILTNSPKQHAVGDLALIAFYYLLRVGEYTIRGKRGTTRTVQFRIRDVTFWHNDTVIPLTADYLTLSKATAATLTISNQKNGTRNQRIHQEAIPTIHCHVKALARRVSHILHHTANLDTIISTYFHHHNKPHSITASDMNNAVKNAVIRLNMNKHGFTKDLVGSHSLRAGGAMAIMLNGGNRDIIRKMGRWSSDTFLMYIHEQIAHLSAGVAAKMSTTVPFHNVAGPTLREADDPWPSPSQS